MKRFHNAGRILPIGTMAAAALASRTSKPSICTPGITRGCYSSARPIHLKLIFEPPGGDATYLAMRDS